MLDLVRRVCWRRRILILTVVDRLLIGILFVAVMSYRPPLPPLQQQVLHVVIRQGQQSLCASVPDVLQGGTPSRRSAAVPDVSAPTTS